MIKVPIDKTQSLIDEYKNIKYFCPYPLCRSLFKDIHNDHKIQVVKEGYTYQCIHCGEHFNRSTYEEKSKCGKSYQIHKTLDKTKDEYLEFHIGNLWNEYYTDREIHTITHFSKDLVGKVTKEFRNKTIDFFLSFLFLYVLYLTSFVLSLSSFFSFLFSLNIPD